MILKETISDGIITYPKTLQIVFTDTNENVST